MNATRRAGLMMLAGPILAAACGDTAAQTSTSFKVTEQVVNAGGHPLDGSRPVSAGFKVSQGAIGDAAALRLLASASYRADGGFVVRYAPPGEVRDLRFLDTSNLGWSDEPSIGAYNLYRQTLASLPGTFGSCHASALPGPAFGEAETPVPGSGWFYLVTAENRLREEGTKGHSSSGAERGNASSCP